MAIDNAADGVMEAGYYWGSLMPGAVLASVPIACIYVFFLDYYVSGLTAGGVKG